MMTTPNECHVIGRPRTLFIPREPLSSLEPVVVTGQVDMPTLEGRILQKSQYVHIIYIYIYTKYNQHVLYVDSPLNHGFVPSARFYRFGKADLMSSSPAARTVFAILEVGFEASEESESIMSVGMLCWGRLGCGLTREKPLREGR